MHPLLEQLLLLLARLLRRQVEAHARQLLQRPRWPAPGRVVLYHLDTSEWIDGRGSKVLPALVTSMHSPECVNLTVFPDGQEMLFRKSSVQISDTGGPQAGRWCWPPREAAI